MKLQHLGRVDYEPTAQAMQAFTAQREPGTEDQLWICEHPPVYTQGLAGKAVHLLDPGHIPVVQTNRGGQVTYHGPGQVVAYPLLNLQRAGYFVKEYVYRLEEAVIKALLYFGVTGHRVGGAPGIYVRLNDPRSHAMLPQRPARATCADATSPEFSHRDNWNLTPINSIDFQGLGKIAALGIKVSRQCTYHGLALNVSMDLEPYSRINPCGYQGLRTVDLSTIGVAVSWQEAADVLSQKVLTYLAP